MRRSLPRYWPYLVGAFFAVAPGAADAQSRTLYNSDQVPRDLVLALLSFDGGDVPELLIGEIPRLLAPRLPLPPGTRVLGTRLSITSVNVVVETRASADSVRAFFARELPTRGWRPAGNRQLRGMGGFMPAAIRPDDRYCSEKEEQLRFSMVPNARGILLLRLSIEDAEFAPDCSPNRNAYRQSIGAPTLVVPSGTIMMPDDCRGVAEPGSAFSSGAVVRAPVSVDSLMQHFARQFADSGWTSADAAPPAVVRTGSWTKRLPGGESRSVTVTITSPKNAPTCQALSMSVRFGGER